MVATSDGRENPFIDAALEFRPARCVFVRPFGEENLRPQRLERIAASNSIRHLYEGVEGLGIRICDGMVEVGQDRAAPILPGRYDRRKVGLDFWARSSINVGIAVAVACARKRSYRL